MSCQYRKSMTLLNVSLRAHAIRNVHGCELCTACRPTCGGRACTAVRSRVEPRAPRPSTTRLQHVRSPPVTLRLMRSRARKVQANGAQRTCIGDILDIEVEGVVKPACNGAVCSERICWIRQHCQIKAGVAKTMCHGRSNVVAFSH